jgi:hypothetical protein
MALHRFLSCLVIDIIYMYGRGSVLSAMQSYTSFRETYIHLNIQVIEWTGVFTIRKRDVRLPLLGQHRSLPLLTSSHIMNQDSLLDQCQALTEHNFNNSSDFFDSLLLKF